MNFNDPRNSKYRGLHFNDPFQEWLKGHTAREEAIKDLMKLSREVLDYRHDLFPVRSVPVPTHPGYVTYDRDYFTIDYSGKVLKDYLNDYFSEDTMSSRERISYGAHDLAEFFELVLHELLVDGISIHAIEWGEKNLRGKKILLPISFHGINPSTIRVVKSKKPHILRQHFSWIAKFVNDYFDYKDEDFEEDELLLFIQSPIYKNSPVGRVLKYLKDLRAGISFGLINAEASNNPKYNLIQFEKARGKSGTPFWRKQNITRVKVRRLLKQNIVGLGVNLTPYYQVYAFREYKKHLNFLRDYLVDEFNGQVLSRIQAKNNIKRPIIMRCTGFTSNETIDRIFQELHEGKITGSEFVEKTKDDLGL